MTYTRYPRGSEWRRWDLHIHTPETQKNDQFEGSTPQDKWEKYIDTINSYPDDIAVIGITDYYSIENYLKFKAQIATGRISKRFEMVIPNIEIRVTPVTGISTPINLHCIFNPDIENDIEYRFLSKLKFNFSGSDYSAQKSEIIRLGRALPKNSAISDEGAFKAGIDQYVVDMSTLRMIFEKDTKLRENTIIVVSNSSNDGASGLSSKNHSDFLIAPNASGLDATRFSIYQFADAIFSSNNKDVLYFLGSGPDNRNTVIEKCGNLMPCFHGCDAHENTKVFKPHLNRFCWIKADPTFEGLKQTIYEPEDRVKIQAVRPDIKNDRSVISSLTFTGSTLLFGDQTILLNQNLNAIIGGKSSGKSLLLYMAANSIDPEQVKRTSDRLKFEGYILDGVGFEVTWLNGDKDSEGNSTHNNKITYIPQLYINHLVEKNNKAELNSLVENILLQDSTFKEFFDSKKAEIKNISAEVMSGASEFLQIRDKALDLQKKSKEMGKASSLIESATQLKVAIEKGQRASDMSESEIDSYNLLITQKLTKEKQIEHLNERQNKANRILAEVKASKVLLLGGKTESSIITKGKIEKILDEFTNIDEDLTTITIELEKEFTAVIYNLEERIAALKIDEKKSKLQQELEAIVVKLRPLLTKISGQKELEKLTIKLTQESNAIVQAQNLEKQIGTVVQDYDKARENLGTLLRKRYEFYLEIETKVNSERKEIGADISLKCSLLKSTTSLPLFEQVNKSAINSVSIFYDIFHGNSVNYEKVLELFNNRIAVKDGKLFIQGDKEIPLKQDVQIKDVVNGLVRDIFSLDYTVSYRGDDLLSMSPGKKGTVLLILFLQINSSEYPILIDQPEDNLDNRTIYELLCQIIKQKKKDRQIIIVSHNANLVVATDAENIIVANQTGQDAVASAQSFRFEYVNGALEHSFSNPHSPTIGILHQQGIKEHVCDILEGGDEAFKQRERKYSIK